MRHPLLLPALVLASSWMLSGCDLFLNPQERVQRADERIAAHDYRGAMIELKNALEREPEYRPARLRLAEVLLQLGDVASAEKELRRAIELGEPADKTADLAARVRLEAGQYRDLLAQIDAGELPLPAATLDLYRGRAFLGMQQPEPALQAFQRVLASDPNSIRAELGKAEATALQGDSDSALELIGQVLRTEPEAAEAWLLRGSILARRGQLDLAEEALAAARKDSRNQFTARQEAATLAILTEVQLARGKIVDAAATQKQLAQAAPGNAVAQLLAGRVALAAQDYPKAVAELQRLVAANPNFIPAQFFLGAAQLAQGNLRQAEAQLSAVVARAPENLEARKLLAQVQMRLDRPDAAIQALQSTQQADGGDAQIELMLGVAKLQQGDTVAGLAHLERSAAANGGDRNLQLDLATAYLRAGLGDKAVAVLRKLDTKAGDIRQSALLVTALMSTRGVVAARAQVEQLLQAQPDTPAVLNLGAAFLAQQREFAAARQLLERSAAIDAKNVATLLTKARVEMLANGLPAAQQALEGALALDPSSKDARMALAGLLLRERNPAAAIETLEELRKSDEQALEPRLLLLRIYLEQRRPQAAEDMAREISGLAQGRGEVPNALGKVYLETGRYDEALAQFRSATELDGASPNYWLNVARAQLALDRRAYAREALNKALSIRADWLPAVGGLALLDAGDHRAEAALARVSALKQARPDDVSVAVLEGDVLAALQRYREAAQVYDRAAALRPGRAIAVKAYRVRELGKLTDAGAPLVRWLAREPGDKEVRALLAEVYQRSGDRAKAIEQYELTLQHGSPTPIMLNNLAWLYHEANDKRAQATAKRAYDMAPDVPAIADTYGWILVQSGTLEAGAKILQKAAGDDGKYPEITYHYAFALAKLGDKEGAKKRLDGLLGQAADFPEARQARELLESLR